LPEDPTTSDLLAHSLASSVDRLFVHLPHPDHHSVHQARVATRRLRSNLQTFGPLLRKEKPLRRDLRELGQLLGRVRDRDVFQLRLTSDAEAAEALRSVWSRRRNSEWDELLHYLESDAFSRLTIELATWVCAPPVRDDGEKPPLDVMGPLVRQRWVRLAELARRPELDPPTLHRVRILTKRVRYGAELVAPVAGKRARRFAATAERLQDLLGEYRDATISHGILLRTGARLPSRHAVVLGELAGVEWARRAEALGQWRNVFDHLDRKRLRRWM
ncbi:MAG: CHAD domain-containing protein, partial [Acidimicrobiia bacterium]